MKHTIKYTCIAAAFALFSAHSAFADITSQGLYITGQLGAAQIATPTTNDRTGASPLNGKARGAFAWGLNAGYQFLVNPNFLMGAELAYHDDGYSSVTFASNNQYRITSEQFDLLATFRYVLNSQWSVFLKPGIARLQQHYSIWQIARNSGIDPVTTTRHFKPVLAVGASFALNNHNALSLTYQHTFGKNLNTISKAFTPTSGVIGAQQDVYKGGASVDSILVGWSYYFN
ncbi:MAG: porin family protein [Legionellales bacterium]|nr:porin family protein [Legionellales bacterium]